MSLTVVIPANPTAFTSSFNLAPRFSLTNGHPKQRGFFPPSDKTPHTFPLPTFLHSIQKTGHCFNLCTGQLVAYRLPRIRRLPFRLSLITFTLNVRSSVSMGTSHRVECDSGLKRWLYLVRRT